MIEKISKIFLGISDRFNVRMKIMGIVLFGIILLGIVATVQTNYIISAAMSEKIENHGVAIARDVAARSTDYIFTNNLFALFELVEDTLQNNADVRYILILDPQGNPIIHTFNRGIPKGLLDINHVERDQRYSEIKIDTEEGLIQDIAVQIFEGRAGTVRLGMSHAGISNIVRESNKRLLTSIGLISLMGIISSLIFTGVLTMPLKRMVDATKEVAAGNYNVKVPVWWSKDEFSHLAVAFNDMTKELCKSNRELEAFSQEIIQHNQELSAYNAILQAANNSFDIKEITEKFLQAIIRNLNVNYGKILIFDNHNQEIFDGIFMNNEKKVPLNSEDFLFAEKIINKINAKNLLLYHDISELTVHIVLSSKNGILGLLTLGEIQDLSDRKQKALISLGNQIGIALENAFLWQENKQKEKIRAQLLQKVITVQEEERKRIARELHDETGQSLTSLLLGLKLIEKSKDMEQVIKRTVDLRKLVVNTLSDINKLALELRPTILDDLGLVAALDRYISNIMEKADIEIDMQVVGMENIHLTPEAEITIYRITQEALTNTLKYSMAKNVSVVLERHKESLSLVIEDDGIGFDQEAVKMNSTSYQSLGLYGMEERATIIGGSLSVESFPGKGTTIYFKVPLENIKKAIA